MITGDNNPGNINTNEFDLNNGGWILIGILIGICAVLLIAFIIKCIVSGKKIDTLESLSKNKMSDKEMEMLLTYRALDDKDKIIINDTLKTLSKNHIDTDKRL